ncbi:chemotaxis protein CheB [Salipiger sp. IMCC34102]|uniref:chemotaxis protein CheB n=1 Tax=Salipiger sp. IMCC34102 TaxID=2510647 RepID=UPI0013EE30B1|nr:chemotaxis protein CheB [Salipiger sp. IMCC34102]
MSATLDTIVIGGSAGSFTALKTILPDLDRSFPATILICQHIGGHGETRAIDLLQNLTDLPLRQAFDGMSVEPGCAIFAPPDRHMMLGAGHLHLRRGPHENNFRPAIDPLFRSVAVYRGSRAVGLILSGLMDDGAAGARALYRTGGRILVQEPLEAEFPDMPNAAKLAVPAAEPVPLDRIAARLIDLAGAKAEAPGKVPWDIGVELKISSLEAASMKNEDRLGELSPYNCPHCNGVLWEIEDGPLIRYRCHTGHAYTIDALGEAQEDAMDRGLFDALRAHRGRAALIQKMADNRSDTKGSGFLERRAAAVHEDADMIEEIIKRRHETRAGQSDPDRPMQ